MSLEINKALQNKYNNFYSLIYIYLFHLFVSMFHSIALYCAVGYLKLLKTTLHVIPRKQFHSDFLEILKRTLENITRRSWRNVSLLYVVANVYNYQYRRCDNNYPSHKCCLLFLFAWYLLGFFDVRNYFTTSSTPHRHHVCVDFCSVNKHNVVDDSFNR